MGFTQTIISVLFIILVIMTFMNQPKLSAQYYGEMGKSMLKVGGWCKEAFVGMVQLFQKDKTTTTQEIKP